MGKLPFVYWKPLKGYLENSEYRNEYQNEMQNNAVFHQGQHCRYDKCNIQRLMYIFIYTCDPLKCIMDNPILTVVICREYKGIF